MKTALFVTCSLAALALALFVCASLVHEASGHGITPGTESCTPWTGPVRICIGRVDYGKK